MQLEIGALPDYFRHLWLWFHELSKGREYTGSEPLPLTWQGIKSWSELMHNPLLSADVKIIKKLDRIYLNSK